MVTQHVYGHNVVFHAQYKSSESSLKATGYFLAVVFVGLQALVNEQT